MNDSEKRILLLEDALDHIMKVASQAHRPTKRLNWISDRARLALSGHEYSEDLMPQYPKNNGKEYLNIFLNNKRYLWLRDIGDNTWTPLAKRSQVNFTHEIDSIIDKAIIEAKK